MEYYDKYLKYKTKYYNLKKNMIGGGIIPTTIQLQDLKSSINILYDNLKQIGNDGLSFYSNLNKFNFNNAAISLNQFGKIPTNTEFENCFDREDKKNKYIVNIKNSYIYLIFFEQKCRLGRDMTICDGYIECSSNGVCDYNEPFKKPINCGLCTMIQRHDKLPCLPMHKYKILHINESGKYDDVEKPGVIIVPNTYPYFDKHFLITTYLHNTQRLLENYEKYYYYIIKIATELLDNETGTMFFSAMCGYSQIHIHNQYTSQHDFPIFNYINKPEVREQKLLYYINNGIYLIYPNNKNPFFTGLLFECENFLDNVKEFKSNFSDIIYRVIQTAINKKFFYNYVISKNNNKFQFILFIRNNCTKEFIFEEYIPQITKHVGANECAGLFGLSDDNQPPKEEEHDKILRYINYMRNTNNIQSIATVINDLNVSKIINSSNIIITDEILNSLLLLGIYQ